MNALAALDPCTIPPEDEALRMPVREALGELLRDMPPHRRVLSWMGVDAEFSRECEIGRAHV